MMALTVFGVAIARPPGNGRAECSDRRSGRNGVRYIDGLQVAVVQSDPSRERLGLSHRPHRVHQHRIVLAED